MELKGFDGAHVRLILSQHELGMMGNALNEVCNGFAVADFATRMGGEEPKVHRVLRDIIPIYRKMEKSESPYASVRFSRFELRAIIGALKTVCEELDPPEFATRMGATRAEVDEILDAIVPIYRQMREAERSAEDDKAVLSTEKEAAE